MEQMESLLKTAAGAELSEYHIRLLLKHNINTPLKFVTTELSKLSKLLIVSAKKIGQMKVELIQQLGTAPVSLKMVYQKSVRETNCGTGIEELDNLLESIGQPFQAGRVWELCGLVGVGKTELMYSLALNFVLNSSRDKQAFFIDSKHDFSGSRIHQMLRERQVEAAAAKSAMQAIKVEQVDTAQSLIAMLEALLAQLKAGTEATRRIRLVLIDSLPACWLHFRSDDERMLSRQLLTQLASLVRRLATSQQRLAFVLGNLSFPQRDDNAEDNDYEYCEDSQPQEVEAQDHSMLGRYWSTVSTLRLALEQPPTAASEDDGLRLLKVLKNSCGASGGNCLLRISDAGLL